MDTMDKKIQKNKVGIVLLCLAVCAIFGTFSVLGPKIYRTLNSEKIFARANMGFDKDDVAVRAYERDYLELARLYHDRKLHEDAIDFYKRVLSINSWNTDALIGLADVYKRTGQFDMAVARYKDLVDLNSYSFNGVRAKVELALLPPRYKSSKSVIEIDGPLRPLIIRLLPFGFDEPEFMDKLRLKLQDVFKIKFEVLPPLTGLQEGYIGKSEQYNATTILSGLAPKYSEYIDNGENYSVLVVSAYDITELPYNFVFGYTDENTKMGIISFARFGVDKPNSKELLKRTSIQAFSSVGFLLGMPRCSISGCARAYTHSLLEFKKKKMKLCDECLGVLQELLDSLLVETDFEPASEMDESIGRVMDRLGSKNYGKLSGAEMIEATNQLMNFLYNRFIEDKDSRWDSSDFKKDGLVLSVEKQRGRCYGHCPPYDLGEINLLGISIRFSPCEYSAFTDNMWPAPDGFLYRRLGDILV